MNSESFNILFRMIRKIAFFVILTLTTSPVYLAKGSSTLEKSSTKAMTAELLIICDKQFADSFEQDRQKIADYWAMLIWDVNMKFKTIPKLDITFRVSHIHLINDTKDQPFIEAARNAARADYTGLVYKKFAAWVYSKYDNLKQYDIAILATRAAPKEYFEDGYAMHQTACQNKHSVVTVNFENLWDIKCSLVEQPLGKLLGAESDSTRSDVTSGYCKSNPGFVMDIKGSCDIKRFLFSNCSDKHTSYFVSNHNTKCLQKNDAPPEDGSVNASKITYPPSLEEQCARIAGSKNVTLQQDGGADKCVKVNCMKLEASGNWTLVKRFYPLDNSPCGNEKFCFRGRCLQIGHLIYNVGTGTCLHMRDRFKATDQPIMVPCPAVPTQLDQHRMEKKGALTVFLKTPYSTSEPFVNGDKCLSVDAKKENLQYADCTSAPGDKTEFEWKLLPVNETKNQFHLQHVPTKLCAFADSKQNVKVNQACSSSDGMTTWKFHDRFDIP